VSWKKKERQGIKKLEREIGGSSYKITKVEGVFSYQIPKDKEHAVI